MNLYQLSVGGFQVYVVAESIEEAIRKSTYDELSISSITVKDRNVIV